MGWLTLNSMETPPKKIASLYTPDSGRQDAIQRKGRFCPETRRSRKTILLFPGEWGRMVRKFLGKRQPI